MSNNRCHSIGVFLFIVSVCSSSILSGVIGVCDESGLTKRQQLIADLSERHSPRAVLDHVVKSRGYYHKHQGQLHLKHHGDLIVMDYLFYRSTANPEEEKKPLIFVFSGVSGVSLLERYMANHFTSNGFHVVLSQSQELRGLEDLNNLRDKTLRTLREGFAFVDHFSQLPFVDSERLGILGTSFGGYRALYLMNLDDRIKAGSLVVTGSSAARAIAYSSHPLLQKIRKVHMEKLQLETVEEYIHRFQEALPFQPTELLCRRSPKDFLLFLAARDEIVPYLQQLDLWAKLGRPKKQTSYFGHVGGALISDIFYLRKMQKFFRARWSPEVGSNASARQHRR